MKKILDILKSNIVYNFVLILILTFITIVLVNDSHKIPLDIDEIFTLNILYMDNLSEIIRLGNILDNHPPLYHLIMYFFTKCFGLSEQIIRIPSIIFSIISFYLVSVLGKKFHSTTYGFTSLIITAILIPKLFIAFYARGYALLLLLSILTMINLVNIIKFKTENPNKQVPFNIMFYYIFSSLMCVYTHYFGCILIFCELLFLFMLFYKKVIKEIVVIVISLTLLFGPWLLVSHLKKVHTTTPNFIDWLNWSVFSKYNVYWLLAIIAIGIIYFICNLKKHSKEEKIYFSLMLYLFLFPFLLIYFTHNFIIKCYQPKYLIISLVPFYMMISATFIMLLENKINLILALITFYMLSIKQFVPSDNFTEYNLSFAINNHNNFNRPIVIIDKHSMYIKYYKYHIDNYAVPNNIYFIYDFDNDKIIEEIDKAVAKNNNRYVWLIDATSIYDIDEISSKKNIVKINKDLPSIYLAK